MLFNNPDTMDVHNSLLNSNIEELYVEYEDNRPDEASIARIRAMLEMLGWTDIVVEGCDVNPDYACIYAERPRALPYSGIIRQF